MAPFHKRYGVDYLLQFLLFSPYYRFFWGACSLALLSKKSFFRKTCSSIYLFLPNSFHFSSPLGRYQKRRGMGLQIISLHLVFWLALLRFIGERHGNMVKELLGRLIFHLFIISYSVF